MGVLRIMFDFAPSSARFWLRRKLVWLGRGDAKRYAGTLDSTPTHAVLLIQSLVQSGQHGVNSKYLEEARQLSQSIAVLKTSSEYHENLLVQHKSQALALKGRLLDKNLALQSGEIKKLDDLRNQLASNEKQLEIFALEAQSALDSWASYYQLLASIYLRRRMRIRGNSATLDADVPVFQGISLAEVPTIDSKRGAKG